MNLMKLFKRINLKFLKENIRKSRGLLAFCFGVVPLINILILIIITSSLKNTIEILDFNSISIVTYIGLFIIPIVLAVSLFGFVFKSKSVDFVLSKPLSRSTIYITNIVGGMIIITIFMLLNSLIYILFGLFFSGLIIPFNLILDYFILFLISYVFIFIVASLAISLAGNLMGSIVLILILICLVPFFKGINVYYLSNHRLSTYIKCADLSCRPENYNCYKSDICINHLKSDEYEIQGEIEPELNFPAPFYSIENLDDGSTLYSTKSIIKMLILIPVCTLVGFYLFRKRKMENNETSFKNIKLHYFIKSITLVPISFICYLIIKEATSLGLIISIAIILIYSVVYDLITRKEIYKFFKSGIIGIVILSISLGLFGLYDIYMNNNVQIVNDIKKITINDITIQKDKIYKLSQKEIKGEDLINKIIKETLEASNNSYTYYNVQAKNNKNYRLGLNWNQDTNKEIEEIKNNLIKDYFKNYDYDNIDFTGMYLKPTKELKNLIKETMTNIDNYTYNNYYFLLEVATYQNHQYEKFYIMPNINKELDKYVMKERNKQAINFLEENSDCEYNINSEEFTLFDYVISKNINQFKNYLKNNNNDITNNNVTIYAYSINNLNILIGDKEAFKEEYKKYEANLVNDEYYQRLLESYNLDPEIEEDYIEEYYEY